TRTDLRQCPLHRPVSDSHRPAAVPIAPTGFRLAPTCGSALAPSETARSFIRRISGRAARLVAITLVTLQACIREVVADVAHGLLASRLRGFVGSLADVNQLLRELLPVVAVDWNGSAVLASPVGHEQQRRRIRDAQRGVVDDFPWRIDDRAPLRP